MKLRDLFVSYKAILPNSNETETPAIKQNVFEQYVDRLNAMKSSSSLVPSPTSLVPSPDITKSSNQISEVPSPAEQPIITQEEYKKPETKIDQLQLFAKELGIPMNLPSVSEYQESLLDNSYKDTTTQRLLDIRKKNNKDYTKFRTSLMNWANKNKVSKEDMELLDQIAGLESSYNQFGENPKSTALGWFQILDKTRNGYNNYTRKEFLNNSDYQFDTAYKHLNYLKKLIQDKGLNKIKNHGLTNLQMMYGLWWRPKSLINYIIRGKDDYVNEPDNVDLQKILERAS